MTALLDCEKQKSMMSGLLDAEETQTIVNILFRIRDAFGFSVATILVMPARTDREISKLILESSLPPEFFSEYDRVGGSEGCILFEELRSTILPVAWTMNEMHHRYSNLGRKFPEFYALHDQFGLSMGVAFPLSTTDGSRHIIMYEGNGPELSPEQLNELFMLTMHVFQAYDRVRGRSYGGVKALTARELEVVNWTAAGKTSVEIGWIMELSDHTVNAYLNNALKKLDCVSRTQLVAKALRLRVIS